MKNQKNTTKKLTTYSNEMNGKEMSLISGGQEPLGTAGAGPGPVLDDINRIFIAAHTPYLTFKDADEWIKKLWAL